MALWWRAVTERNALAAIRLTLLVAAMVADRFGWGLVNVNLRGYYGEGSKTLAFEIVEQLGCESPLADQVRLGRRWRPVRLWYHIAPQGRR